MKKSEKPIIIEQSYSASINKVWKALTELDEMKQWYFRELLSFKPVPGFETRFVVQAEDRIFPHVWKVTEVVPGKKIEYEWSYEGYPGSSIATFELSEKSNRTKLKFTFTTIEDFPDNIPEFKRESGVQGWNYFIQNSLKDYLDGQFRKQSQHQA